MGFNQFAQSFIYNVHMYFTFRSNISSKETMGFNQFVQWCHTIMGLQNVHTNRQV